MSDPPIGHITGTDLIHRPVPSHAGQITGVQVCAFPSQVHPRAGTRPLPRPPWHWSFRLASLCAPKIVPFMFRSGPRQSVDSSIFTVFYKNKCNSANSKRHSNNETDP